MADNVFLTALRAVEQAREEEGCDAAAALEALETALHASGLELPGLHADGCTCGRMPGVQYVELGRVTVDQALRLAHVIVLGAASVLGRQRTDEALAEAEAAREARA